MKKPFFLILMMVGIGVFGQNITSGKWGDLFSYNNVLAMKADGNKIVAATENGIFYYDTVSGEVTKLSKANGLHEVKISAFDYNPDTKCGLVGYTSGAMDLITPKGITYVVDIPIATSYTGSKKINHIAISGNRAAIATGYGVSIYNMDTQGFGDSAFFSNGGSFNACNSAAISGNTVYAATADSLRSHKLDPTDPTLPIYHTWQALLPGNFVGLAAHETTVAAATKTAVFVSAGTGFSQSANFSSVVDVSFSGQNFAVTEAQSVTLLNLSGAPVKTLAAQENLNTGIGINGKVYAGTAVSGIIDEEKKSYRPDGPYNNASFKLLKIGNELWVTSGIYYNFKASPLGLGYYHYDGSKWLYPDYFLKNESNFRFNVLEIAVNPSNLKELFFTNAVQGGTESAIFKMYEDQFSALYNEPDHPYIRVPVNVSFDENNELYATKQWATLVVGSGGRDILLSHYARASDKFENYPDLVTKEVYGMHISDGMIYINSSNGANGSMVLYKYNKTPSANDDVVRFLRDKDGMPTSTPGALSSAVDNYGDLWIGGMAGLRTLQNPVEAVTDQGAVAKPIVITQNGVGEEVFRDTHITCIAVDSGNHKWISAEGGGVYYLSADGQQTILHFTKANSPLPTDEVTDIKIDEKDGTVYFVTHDGIVTYKGDVANVSSNFGNVLVYPNPVVYSSYKGNVKIRGLADTTNIRITDAAGNLVHQAVARGGFFEWDLNNMRGNRVASGIYFVLMTNGDGTDKATAKIAVVN